jgi:hypothetical protein
MSRRTLLLALAVLVLGAAWYLFRPERLFIDRTVSEELPAAAAGEASLAADAPVAVLAGRFHSNAHETMGVATIYRLADGRYVLRLTEFETSNGPDVQIYLVAADDVTDNETVSRAGFVGLGPMKGNVGDQNYDVPQGVDLSRYRAVTIWCRRFSVNFGTAPLSESGAPGA